MTIASSAEDFASKSFDYVIVGGGTAGLVVATRLSEDPSIQVGVLEAGGWSPDTPGINIPGLGGTLIGNPEYDWGLRTVPQVHANGRQITLPRGKGLGGSSLLNLLIWDRASAQEYDAIEALGNPGWNWQEFLKYFRKSETTQPPPADYLTKYSIAEVAPEWHGEAGPLRKSYALHFPFGQMQDHLVKTYANLGIPLNPDAANGNKVGLTSLFTTVDAQTATRTYSANAYYKPNAHRQNLIVLTGAAATKLTFRRGSSPLQATGVEFLHGGKKYQVGVKKEVVLSAGSFMTPQLLELSGVGGRQILEKYGIETLVDLPAVGENLQEHPYAPVICEIDPQYETLDGAQDPERAARLQELYKSKQGFLSSAAAVTFSFIPMTHILSEQQLQAWKTDALAATRDTSSGLRKQYEEQIRWYTSPSSAEVEVMHVPGFLHYSGMNPEPGKRYVSLAVALLHPLSRGSVHITSADPQAPPAIDPNMFSNPRDLQSLAEALRYARKLFETDPFREIARESVCPTADDLMSDGTLAEYVKKTFGCVFHPLGTASMLPREDGGVVDPELRVYGTANVRVVDASILPIQIAAHTQATVYAVAEKAADIIRGL